MFDLNRTTALARLIIAGACALAGTTPAVATEGGGSTYPGGAENYLMGAAPPPGLHVLEYVASYSADKLADNSGNALPINFKLRAVAASTRIIWISQHRLLGGNFGLHAVIPLMDLKVDIGALNISQRKRGLGDITFGPAITYHHSPTLHSVAGVDFVAPTGRYDKNDSANLGRNYWSVNPFYSMSTVSPSGLNADLKFTLVLNGKNSDTDYKSGDEAYLDYAAGWGLGNGLVVGVSGYATQQLNDDELAGATVANQKSRAFAIGPSVKYQHSSGWFITAKFTPESNVRNRPDGKQFWIKTVLPF